MEAEVLQVKGGTFIGRCDSKHWMVFDSPESVGGSNSGPTPMEAVLMSMGACTGIDLGSLFRKMQVDYDRLEIRLSAKRAEEHPKMFTEVEIRYIITGENVDEDKVRKAIGLSMDTYCSVTHMVKKAAKVSYSIAFVKSHVSPVTQAPAPPA